MLKQMALFFTLAMTGIASAISTSWTSDATGAKIATDGVFVEKTDVVFTSSFSIACVFTVANAETFLSDNADKILIGATLRGKHATGPSLYMAGNGQVGGKARAVTNTAYSSVGTGSGSAGTHYENLGTVNYGELLVNGQNNAVLTVQLSGPLSSNGIVVTYDLYINNTKVLTVVHGDMTNTDGYKQLAVNGDAYYMDGIATAEDIASLPVVPVEIPAVPEPTAVALLALGVAGLALRRKA